MDAASWEAENWHLTKAIFLEAVELSETERDTFVSRACAGNIRLRDEINSLLRSEEAAESFLETAAAGVLEAAPVIESPTMKRLEPGTVLGEYEITRFHSAGGMGAVYHARHRLLGRGVAIKTVNTGMAGRKRLIREARHASSLSHPNICTIYEVGEAEGIPFIAMEFVDGRTLREIIRTDFPTLQRSVDYGVQISDALEHAHEHGIVHRDLKSSNVVVNAAGRPVVLDFGLAKRFTDSGASHPADSTLTGTDGLAGTLTHMAPEVLLGRVADARSDVWSLGVLLYELVTGELPFSGATPFETSRGILSEPLRPIRGSTPLAVRLVIERCLVKDPAARYQRAAEVRDALDAIRQRRSWPLAARLLVLSRRRSLYAAGGALLLVIALVLGGSRLRHRLGTPLNTRISTLAVLTLENATGDPSADYYVAGFTDGLIDQLGNMSGIRIIARPSASRVAQQAKSRAEIASRLGADAIVEGRLRKRSDRVAVELRLIEPSSGRVVWSDAYERNERDALALQADLVRALVTEVRLTGQPGARGRAATARAVNPAAYEAYLKGRYEWNKRTPSSLRLAIAWFAEALALDPTYAPAHAAIADCYNQFGTMMVATGSPREFRPKAAAAAIKALQIDPFSSEGHAALGYVHHYNWQWADAEREFRQAIALNPNYPLAYVWYANLLMSRGRLDEALAQVRIARGLDPFSLIVNSNVGWVLNVANRHDEAVRHLEWTLQLDSTYSQALWRLVMTLRSAGRLAESQRQAERLVTLTNRSSPAVGLLAEVSFAAGRENVTRALLAELLLRARAEYVPPASIAAIYSLLGDTDNQLMWTARAFEEKSNAMSFRKFDSGVWESDPRFAALLARSGPK